MMGMKPDLVREWAEREAQRRAYEEGFASAFAAFVFFCACLVLAWWIGSYFILP